MKRDEMKRIHQGKRIWANCRGQQNPSSRDFLSFT